MILKSEELETMVGELPPVRRVGVIGVGAMGASIAHLTSSVGLETVIKVRARPGAIEQAWQTMRASYAREVEAGRASPAEAEAGLARLRITDDYAELGRAGCEIVIESVPEHLAIKHEVLQAVEAVTHDDCIFASNTSSLPIAWLARRSKRPDRVVGMHYFWPAHRQPLLEISALPDTAPEVLKRVRLLGRQQGRVELLVRDSPGFLTTRILMPYVSEAVLLVGQGVSVDQVDAALEAFGWRMGPFRLMDVAGIETVAYVHDCLRPFLGERIAGLERLWPLVRAGYVGRRVNAGFYTYGPEGRHPNPVAHDMLRTDAEVCAPEPDELVHRPVWMMVREAALCVAEGVVASWEEADVGANLGLGFPMSQGGLLAYRKRIGDAVMRRQFAAWERRYGPRFCL